MHEHDGKLDRAGTERIELMEVCPVCGEQRRNNARFCTTCGHRFATNEIAHAPAPSPQADATIGSRDMADPIISGWPAPSAETAASPWAPRADVRGGWPAPPVDAPPNPNPAEVTWAEVAATAYSAPPEPQASAVSPDPAQGDDDFDAIDEIDQEAAQAATRAEIELRQRARSLLSELQDVIEGLTGDASSASSDLAGELEISLTRPAALEGEALSDLRAAAEAAQERPRDLDTITALTARAETILALIVGYERATAGIERAIERLRVNPARAEE
jgi:hypothetical protein